MLFGVEAAPQNQILFHHTENVTPLLQYAKHMRDNSDRGFTQGRTLQEVGVVPFWAQMKYAKRFAGEDGNEEMLKWLKSEEGREYRITNGL